MRFQILLVICSAIIVQAQYEEFFGSRFTHPVDLQNDGVNDYVYVVEQEGIIKVLNNTAGATSTLFLNITDRVDFGGEKGLLGLAFHPSYSDNGLFFTYRTQTIGGQLRSRVSRFQVTENNKVADPDTELLFLEFDQPFANHNGGQITFGPDGYLYIATGDGGSAGDPYNSGQNTSRLLGKILRIDVNNPSDGKNYGIPSTNPFATSGGVGEVYAWGLRNPWRFSFDGEGRLWTGDVGQDLWEEISVVGLGQDMGWKVMEGNYCFSPKSNCDESGLIPPVFHYPHDNQEDVNGKSVTGGFVYSGTLATTLIGKYIFADFASSKVWAMTFDDDLINNSVEEIFKVDQISSFGVDKEGELFMLSYSAGKVLRFNGAVDSPSEAAGIYAPVIVSATILAIAF